LYQCVECKKTFTKKQIEEGLAEIKRRRKQD
jgi:DNA-directed RNA polymerase subunit RPC12/RpoP